MMFVDMHRRQFLWVAACGVAKGFQQPADNRARRDDIYAIYTLMLTDPRTSHGKGGNEIILIRDKTVPGTPRVPCVGPPRSSPYERDFAEARADYDQRKDDAPARIEYELKISKNYLILNDADCAEFVKTREPGPKPEVPERFRLSADLFGLTDVYFNSRRTLALTGFSTYCNSVCGGYWWMVFEKTDEGWRQLPWQACRVIA